jgi:hypothetical protein
MGRIVLSVSSVLVAGLFLVACGQSSSQRPVAASVTPSRATAMSLLDRSFSADGGSFSYPSAWHLSTYDVEWSMGQAVAYLSNQPLHDPCSQTGQLRTCGSPLNRLGPGGVLVSWQIVGGPPPLRLSSRPGAATTIGGRPAKVDVRSSSNPDQQCAALGASGEVDAAVLADTLPSHDELWTMTACLSDPQAATSVNNALAVARSLRLGAIKTP